MYAYLLQPEPMETDSEEKTSKDAKQETGEEKEETEGEGKNGGEEGVKDKDEKPAEVIRLIHEFSRARQPLHCSKQICLN